MSIHVALHHRTHYRYDRPVLLGPQVVRLRPAPHSRTRILSYSLRLAPEKHFINWQQDPQSNYLARLVFPEPTREFLVEVDLVAEMAVFNPFDFFLEPQAEKFPFTYDGALDHELEPYQLKCWLTPCFTKYLGTIRREELGLNGNGRPQKATAKRTKKSESAPPPVLLEPKNPRTIDFLVAVNQRLWKDIKYVIRLEPGVQTPEETLSNGTGSCRDSAWLLCQLLRHCGLAARCVSGYLIQLTADVKSLDGPSGTERDFTDLHAWCEVYLPGAGWVGLDPTSGLLAGEGHVPLACAPDPTSAAPITGAVDECQCEFSHEMKVTRVHESPRVTKPYTEAQWKQIEALGHAVDADLVEHDVRLTMGGEPTFVSIDDPDGAEWNTAALGPKKRILADELVKRLKKIYAPGGFLHYGQGKWYPGEPLPRWAFGCYWRKDRLPIWERDDLIADEKENYGHTPDLSDKFIATLATRLGVDPKWVMPGYEDPFYHLWKERRLPVNVDPHKSDLKDELERARLAKLLEQGLDSVVGHTLPIQRSANKAAPGWVSGPWFLRGERLYLAPGDSPMGLRLPLDSLPWVSEADYPYLNEIDPTIPRPPLPEREEFRQLYLQGATPVNQKFREDTTRQPQRGESAAWIVRTALCVEPRQGRLHVFMPPVATLEDYLELLTAVEDTAAHFGTPILIEGYTPPNDPRLTVLKVTPDPGVIEVNLHPATDWNQLVDHTTVLYEEARQSRLGTEKFMIDGRHTGTGGGNHIVIGAATPTDSPLLRRPDLLRSLLAYWQNHPSLSFLFSGLFIGPTSQSPRVDEARNDSLYELEVAFRELDRKLGAVVGQASSLSSSAGFQPAVPPWLVDRLFRHLLVDATGNTHRAEFSIDKLYSPDGPTGRLGLLELRGFEMPPHPHMSLVQQLLIRALVAWFWKTPYQPASKTRLTRWGTQLHDRFMLPTFVLMDFEDVIAELSHAGYPFDAAWFAPHAEFRFPMIGETDVRGMRMTLRSALEPWHVMGEEGGAGGTVRYVDSSVERIELKVSGYTDNRYAIAINGVAPTMQPTGVEGEFVMGVRYKAWSPPSALHPSIDAHAPLSFDIVDNWLSRSLGGCRYHVVHPGGRSYDTLPVNAFEAESRRLARFFRLEHTPGVMQLQPQPPSPEFPFTLDLRRT